MRWWYNKMLILAMILLLKDQLTPQVFFSLKEDRRVRCKWITKSGIKNQILLQKIYPISSSLLKSLAFPLSISCTSFYSILPGASLVAQMVKNLPAVQETWVWSPGWEDPLEKGMDTYSYILAWRIPWTEDPGSYSPWHCKELDMAERLSLHFILLQGQR